MSRASYPSIVASEVGEIRGKMFLVLGLLWLLDGLLQLQPEMFTSSFPTQVLLPSFQALPQPARAVALGVVYPKIVFHEVAFNLAAFAVQLFLGLSLLARPKRLVRPTLAASCLWSALIWVFGQAFGGVFEAGGGAVNFGSPSLYSGFPGSALLYLYLSSILLLPDRLWALSARRRVSLIWDGAYIVFALGLALQLNPALFGAPGQATIFQANLQSNIPEWCAWGIKQLAAFSMAHPALANVGEAAPIAALVALRAAGRRRAAFALCAACLAFMWWFGMGLGGLLTGLGTDPNTPPLLFAASYLSLKKPTLRGEVVRVGAYNQAWEGYV